MTELFNIPEQLSPRLAWLKKHNVKTEHSKHLTEKEEPWAAWVGELTLAIEQDTWETGHTEDDAIVRLTKSPNIPLWNEEGFKQ